MELPVVLHIFDLASLVAFVYWLFSTLTIFVGWSVNARTFLGVVIVAVAGIIDNAIFYSGNGQLINLVTSIYQIILMATGAIVSTQFVLPVVNNYLEKRDLANALVMVEILDDSDCDISPELLKELFPRRDTKFREMVFNAKVHSIVARNAERDQPISDIFRSK